MKEKLESFEAVYAYIYTSILLTNKKIINRAYTKLLLSIQRKASYYV